MRVCTCTARACVCTHVCMIGGHIYHTMYIIIHYDYIIIHYDYINSLLVTSMDNFIMLLLILVRLLSGLLILLHVATFLIWYDTHSNITNYRVVTKISHFSKNYTP